MRNPTEPDRFSPAPGVDQTRPVPAPKPAFDPATAEYQALVDHALMTTRGVRMRLDLEREVSDQTILDCIDVAEQAPTGGNNGSRRWMIIRDQATKDRMAELYLSAGVDWVIKTAERLEGTGHQNEALMLGAKRLGENISQVPALVIPTIIGRHDGSGRPGLFDSVIQSAWSFMVALRARGLGTVWTTMYLNEADAVAELLELPPEVSQICLFPVAYTVGTDFKATSRRYPARKISYFDRYGRTLDRQHSAPRSIDDGPGVVVENEIKANPEKIWSLVTNLDVLARFSDEFQGGRWETDEEPNLGSVFSGDNERPDLGRWTTTSTVSDWERPKRFAWRVGDPENPLARWLFEIEKVPGGCRLRYQVGLGPGSSGLTAAIEAEPDHEPRLIATRQSELKVNMERTVAGIKELAEAASVADDKLDSGFPGLGATKDAR